VDRVQGAGENLGWEHVCGREVEEGVRVDQAYGAAAVWYESRGASDGSPTAAAVDWVQAESSRERGTDVISDRWKECRVVPISEQRAAAGTGPALLCAGGLSLSGWRVGPSIRGVHGSVNALAFASTHVHVR
jgi:hypothetical protein